MKKIGINKFSLYILAFFISITICFGYYPFLFLILGALAITIFLYQGLKFTKSNLIIGWIVICFLWLTGSFYSVAFIRGIKYTITLLCILYISLYIRSNTQLQSVLFKLLYSMSLAHVLLTIIRQFNPTFVQKICNFILFPSMLESQKKFYTGGIWNGNLGISTQTGWNAFFCIIEIGLAYAFYRDTKNKLNLFVLFLGILALLFTNKRAHLIALTLAFGMSWFAERQHKIKRQTLLNIFITFVFCLFGSIWAYNNIPGITKVFEKISSLSGKSLNTISSGRVEIYLSALSYLFPYKYLVGYGTGSSDPMLGTDIHNIYLQILFENGIIGFVTFFSVFMLAFIGTYKQIRKTGINEKNRFFLLFSQFYQVFFLMYGMLGNPLYDTPMLFLYLISIFIVDGYSINKR